MSLRIACDLDGTIADMEGALQREAEVLFGADVVLRAVGASHLEAPTEANATNPKSQNPTPRSQEEESNPESQVQNPGKKVLNRRQLRQLWEHVAKIDNFWASLREIEPGSVAKLAAMRNAHRFEVIFLTQRPDTEGEITQLQTQRWLERHGFELPSVFVLQGSRGKAAGALGLDVVLDDRPENCLEVITESKAKPLLIWRDPPEALPPGTARLGIEAVFSIEEALQRVETMAMKAAPSSFVTRLRNVIGI
jgi:hypothetical protein